MAPPRGDLYGQFIAGDFFRQINNLNQVTDVLNVLVPVQDQKQFQRRIFDAGGKLQLTVGQLGRFELTVPDDETWRLLWVRLDQTDSAPKVVRLEIQPRDVSRPAIIISRRTVQANTQTPLYPSMATNAATGLFFDPRTGPAFEAFPGDVIKLLDETVTAAAGPIGWNPSLRYEVTPPPVIQGTNDDFILAVV